MPLIVFGSPKGGVGKTTVAANVAVALAQLGLRVLALDLDPQNALRLHFAIPLNDVSGFTAALLEETPTLPLLANIRQTRWGVGLLPFGQVDSTTALVIADALAAHPGRLTRPLQDILSDPSLFVIVDMPPGPSSALSAVLPFTDMLVCVLLADAISIAMIPSIEAGRAFGPGTEQRAEGGRLRYVLNQVDPHSRLSRATEEQVRPYLGPRLLGELPRDDVVAEAAAAQYPLPVFAPGSIAAAAIASIARNIAAACGQAPYS
jgi:cellulose synthase operon protein YhjQ